MTTDKDNDDDDDDDAKDRAFDKDETNLIAISRVLRANSDGPTDGPTNGPTKRLIESHARN